MGNARSYAQCCLLREGYGITGNKVLITGATGLLGREVLKAFQARGWELRGLCHSRDGPGLVKCDLFDVAAITAQFLEFQPDIVIHCAAERRPDRLEADKDYANRLNVQVTNTVGSLAKQHGSWLIYLSTNYVFDGKEAPYTEAAKPCPLNVYGESKLFGELEVAKVHPGAAVLRIPLLYGPIEKLAETSVTTLLDAVKTNAPKLDNWQERFPTNTEDLAMVIEAFSGAFRDKGQSNPAAFQGIFHWQSNERHTKYSMGCAIAEIAGIDTKKLVAIDDPPAPGSAPRPQFERMLCARLERLLQIEGQPKQWRSEFKTSMERHLKPFL